MKKIFAQRLAIEWKSRRRRTKKRCVHFRKYVSNLLSGGLKNMHMNMKMNFYSFFLLFEQKRQEIIFNFGSNPSLEMSIFCVSLTPTCTNISQCIYSFCSIALVDDWHCAIPYGSNVPIANNFVVQSVQTNDMLHKYLYNFLSSFVHINFARSVKFQSWLHRRTSPWNIRSISLGCFGKIVHFLALGKFSRANFHKSQTHLKSNFLW